MSTSIATIDRLNQLSYVELADRILDFLEGQYRIFESGSLDASVNWKDCKAIASLLSDSAQNAIDDAVCIANDLKHEIVSASSESKLRHGLEQLLRVLLPERG